MPADPSTIAALRVVLRQARHALAALSQARREQLLRNRPTGDYASQIASARAGLRNARAALHTGLGSP